MRNDEFSKTGRCVANRFAPAREFLAVHAGCCYEERQYHRYQGRTLNEGGGQDHVSADVAHSLGLTGNTFNSFTTDRSYTDTGADGGQTCSNCCVHKN